MNGTADCGTRFGRDGPTRVAAWPGEPLRESATEVVILDRDPDFVAFVDADLARRRAMEDAFIAAIAVA